ncbi:MAG: transglutaminase family protein [Planctomycetota bacterium]
MIYQLTHTSTYAYSGRVARSHQLLRLTPRTTTLQHCAKQQISIEPAPSEQNDYADYFGNPTRYANVDALHETLVVTATSRVSVDQDLRLLPDPGPTWERVRDALPHDRTAEGLYAYQFVYESPMVPVHPRLREFALASFPPSRPLLEACSDLNQRIFHEFDYDPASTTISTPVTQVLEQKSGVCQDYAHLMISCLRSLGLAARYVSGYVRPISSAIAAPDPQAVAGLSPQHPSSAPDQDYENRGASASHAWLSVYAVDAGWIDFDPTNQARPGHLKTDHITLAWGRDYTDVAPIKGVSLGGGAHTISVEVEIKEA